MKRQRQSPDEPSQQRQEAVPSQKNMSQMALTQPQDLLHEATAGGSSTVTEIMEGSGSGQATD